MNRRVNDVISTALFFVMLALLPVFIVGGGVYSTWKEASVVRQALNYNCGTDYSQADVFWAADSLQKLCMMREQRLTIKAKEQ